MPAQPPNRNSRRISSTQAGVHERLDAVVSKHLSTRFQRPYPQHALDAFNSIRPQVENHSGPLIFDSFCGVGESTVNIARLNPEALVIGIDKSLARLDKHGSSYQHEGINNYRLIRADVEDFWRLAFEAGWRLQQHYLLYPNPWPKPSQLKRRVHGSPLLPTLLELGGRVELRSNWPIYPQEFKRALEIAGHRPSLHQIEPDPALTPFERKYQLSGQTLWQCICMLD